MGPLGRCLMESGASSPGVAIVTRPAVDRPRADPVAPATSCRIRNLLPDLSESSVFGPMTHPFDLPPRREASAGGILSPERPQRPRSPSHRDRVGTFFEATRLINADAPLAWPRGALPLRARFQAAPFTRAGNQFLRPRGIGVPPFCIRKGEHHVRSNNDKHRAPDRRAARRHRPQKASPLLDPRARRAASPVAMAAAAHAATRLRKCVHGGRSP